MDILTHSVSGMAVGTVVAAYSKKSFGKRALIVFISTFAGAFPDIDVISLWSGFDGSFGKWFGLSHSGREIYFAKFWYSHHAATHSLFASLVFAGLVALVVKLRNRSGKLAWIYPIAAFCGYQMHLWGDTPTPDGGWGGIMYWFPSKQYLGGWGYTHWWNNYDIFLLLVACILANWLVPLLRQFIKFPALKWLPVANFILAVGLCIYQLGARDLDFNDYSNSESGKSKREQLLDFQRESLGDTLFEMMRKFDAAVPVHF